LPTPPKGSLFGSRLGVGLGLELEVLRDVDTTGEGEALVEVVASGTDLVEEGEEDEGDEAEEGKEGEEEGEESEGDDDGPVEKGRGEAECTADVLLWPLLPDPLVDKLRQSTSTPCL